MLVSYGNGSVHMWTVIHSNTENSSEVSGTAVQEAPTTPENKQPASDLNTVAIPEESPAVEASDIYPCIEKGNNSDDDSSTETVVSSSTEDCNMESVIEPSGCNGEIRRRFQSSTDEDRLNLTRQDAETETEKEFNMKLFLFDLLTSACGLLVSILAIGFGAANIGNCPADYSMPYLVLIMGVLGLLIVSYVLLIISRENFDCLNEDERTAIALATWMLFHMWTWEIGQLSSLDISFDSAAENYCNHAFYTFVILMDIFFGLGFIIGLALLGLDSNRASSPTPGDDVWMPFCDF